MSTQLHDVDPIETQEWLDALSSVLEYEGGERAQYLLENLVKYCRDKGVRMPHGTTTPYLNTVSVENEKGIPGDQNIEHRIRAFVRWNAAAIVLRAGKKDLELGGHIASFQSAATMYEVGFNHFWKAKGEGEEGDLVFFQGHVAPGIYARAFVEGRLTEKNNLSLMFSKNYKSFGNKGKLEKNVRSAPHEILSAIGSAGK